MKELVSYIFKKIVVERHMGNFTVSVTELQTFYGLHKCHINVFGKKSVGMRMKIKTEVDKFQVEHSNIFNRYILGD